MKSRPKTYGHLFVAAVVALCALTLATHVLGGAWLWSLNRAPLILTHVILVAVPVKAYVDEYAAESPLDDGKFFRRCLRYCAFAAVAVYLASVLAAFLAPNLARALRRDTFRAVLTLAAAALVARLVTAELGRRASAD